MGDNHSLLLPLSTHTPLTPLSTHTCTHTNEIRAHTPTPPAPPPGPFRQLEACLRLAYAFAEGGHGGGSKSLSEGRFPALIRALHGTDIAQHPHPQVLLSYLDLAVRYLPQTLDQAPAVAQTMVRRGQGGALGGRSGRCSPLPDPRPSDRRPPLTRTQPHSHLTALTHNHTPQVGPRGLFHGELQVRCKAAHCLLKVGATRAA